MSRTGHICSLCRKIIRQGSECFQLFNKNKGKKGTGNRKGRILCYIKLYGIWTHFRHVDCQYNIKERTHSLEEFIAGVKKDNTNRNRNTRIKKLQKAYLEGRLLRGHI